MILQLIPTYSRQQTSVIFCWFKREPISSRHHKNEYNSLGLPHKSNKQNCDYKKCYDFPYQNIIQNATIFFEFDAILVGNLWTQFIRRVLLAGCTTRVLLAGCTTKVLLAECSTRVLLAGCTTRVLLARCTTKVPLADCTTRALLAGCTTRVLLAGCITRVLLAGCTTKVLLAGCTIRVLLGACTAWVG